MAKPVEIVIWFDDGTRYHIDPTVAKSIFTMQSAAAQCGHHGPYETPAAGAPVDGPFQDGQGPPPHGGAAAGGGSGGTPAATTLSGSCYYVNGVIVCP